MSVEERESYLADVHVAVLSVTAEPGRGPLAVPIWYFYEPGGLVLIRTGANTRKARLIAEAGRFSLCVQDEKPPYRYVSVEGPVVSTKPATEEQHRAMARRYIDDPAAVEEFVAEMAKLDTVAIDLRPERWNSLVA